MNAIPPPEPTAEGEESKPPSIVPADVLDDLRSLVPMMQESANEREARRTRESKERVAVLRWRIVLQLSIALVVALECARLYLEIHPR